MNSLEATLLPTSWIHAALQDVACLIRGVTYKKEHARDSEFEGATPLLRATNISGQGLSFSSRVFVPEAYVSPEQVLRQGDVVIASSSGSKEIVGKAGQFFGAQHEISFGAFCTALRPERALELRYFGYYFQTPNYRMLISDISAGSNINNIKSTELAAHHVPIAPRAEQTRIVEKLEELLSDLDAGVAELKAAQKKLAQYRQSLLKAAVEGALTAEWRAKNTVSESGAQLLARILTERRARWEAKQLAKFKEQGKTPPKDWQDKYPEPVQPDITNLPALPEGWVWATVEQLGEVQLGRQRSPDKVNGICPEKYIRAANITEQGIDFSDVLEMDFNETERETFALKAGDVLLTEASGSPQHVGRPVIWPEVDGLFCFQNTVLRFTPQGISSKFAFRLFHAWQKLGVFSKLSGGVGINHLSAGKFSKLAGPLPSTAEQKACVDALELAFSSLTEQEQCVQHSLKQSAAQRKNILKAAFSGQLVSQDPNDEPASVLLERIRAERAARPKQTKMRKAHIAKEFV